jgi:acyl carrier protein
MVREQELSELIKDWVTRNGQSPNSVHVNGDMDLIANGILDSMGFIELLMFVESIIGRKIDLSELDPTEFTTIQGLSRSIVNSNSRGA